MLKLILIASLLGGCISTVGPLCTQYEEQVVIVNGGTQIKQVCTKWFNGA